MTIQPKLYNILKNIAFQNSEYTDFNEFSIKVSSVDIILWGSYYLFNFDFPVPENMEKEQFKQYFSILFGGRFFDENIAFETETAFKLKLQSKTLEIMPFFSNKISYLINSNIDKLINQRKINTKYSSNSNQKSKSDSKSEGTGKGLESDYPDQLLVFDDVFKNMNRIKSGNATYSGSNSNINAENENKQNDETEVIETYGNFLEFVKSVDDLGIIFDDLLNSYNDLFSLIF